MRFDRQIQTALRLIKKNGEKVKYLINQNSLIPNTQQPWKQTEINALEKNPFICFLPDNSETKKFLYFIKGMEIPTGGIIGLMGQVDFEPKLSDTIIRNGVELRIKNINLLSPNGQKILWTFEFKE